METTANWQPATGLILSENETLLNVANPSESAENVTQQLTCLRAALELSPVPVYFLSRTDFSFLSANSAALEYLGTDASELRDLHLHDFVAERDLADFQQLLDSIRAGKRDRGAVSVSSGDGIGLARVILERVGDIVVAVDQTELRGPQRLESLSETDPLTGLLNRRVLEHRIQLELDREDKHWGLLFIDLNNYKEVNDRYGHVAGDKVMVDFAKQLQASIRPGDLLARYGGDEFVILVKRIPSGEHLRMMADRIAAEVSIGVGAGSDIRVTASVGCAMASSECETVEDMVSAADRDMYRIKRSNSK